MDNINSPGKLEGKGLFKGLFQIFTKQNSSPKLSNNKIAHPYESKSSSPKSGTYDKLSHHQILLLSAIIVYKNPRQ